MRFRDTLKTSLTGLKTNKMQSALTILGIVISIAAIIMIMSIGAGAQDLILQEISGFGSDIIVIRPGKEPKGPSDIGDTLFSDSLTKKDIEALKKKSNVPELEHIVPGVLVPGSVSYEGETYRPTIFGYDAEFIGSALNIYPEEGQYFTEQDIEMNAKVVVIGSKVKEELFGSAEALGEYIKIKGKNFKVVAILPQKGQVSFFNVDEVVLLPYTTAQSQLLGIDYFQEVLVIATSPEAVEKTVRDIELTLREMHNITDPEDDDFYVLTMEGTVQQIKNILQSLTILLSSVVAIALVVGGIGVMNIMLVSVTERTHEIGLRKAVGATNQDILLQFLLESVSLTVIGGAVGIIIGGSLSMIVTIVLQKFFALNWIFTIPLISIILGLSVAAAVGVVFGLYPARKASQKSPIEALRFE